MTKQSKSYEVFQQAKAVRDRILSGQVNETKIQAWAHVARLCAVSENLFRSEVTGVHGRSHQSFLRNLDKLNWAARAQVETLGRA